MTIETKHYFSNRFDEKMKLREERARKRREYKKVKEINKKTIELLNYYGF